MSASSWRPPLTGTPSIAGLFSAYHGRIRRYILGIVRDAEEADDLTQEVFLRAHLKLGSLRAADAALPWLYRIATNVNYDRLPALALTAARRTRVQ